MDDPAVISAIEEQAKILRRAVDACDFATAENGVRRYAELIAQLPPAEALPHLEDACRLIDWARRSLSAARARLQCVHEYSGEPPVPSWRVDV